MSLAGECLQIIDQMDELWQFFARTRNCPLNERIQAFRERIIEEQPDPETLGG